MGTHPEGDSGDLCLLLGHYPGSTHHNLSACWTRASPAVAESCELPALAVPWQIPLRDFSTGGWSLFLLFCEEHLQNQQQQNRMSPAVYSCLRNFHCTTTSAACKWLRWDEGNPAPRISSSSSWKKTSCKFCAASSPFLHPPLHDCSQHQHHPAVICRSSV